MLEIILVNHKKQIKTYLIRVAALYLGLLTLFSPVLIIALMNILYMDDDFSGNSLSYLYLFASLVLMVLLVVSTSFTTFWMGLQAKGDQVLHQVYFFLFSIISASAASAFVVVFILVQLVALIIG